MKLSVNSLILKSLKTSLKTSLSLNAPPPKLKPSEWADRERKLSQESASEPGQWRTDRAPYQREIMDAVVDPKVHTIAVMTSAQVGKTSCLENILGYFMVYDPCPVLLLQP